MNNLFLEEIIKQVYLYVKGNANSGNHGHRGRPGQVGGSGGGGTEGERSRTEEEERLLMESKVLEFAREGHGKKEILYCKLSGNGVEKVDGEDSQVEIPERILRRQEAVVHNHPSGASFSAQDVNMLMWIPGMKYIEAVSPDGTIFRLEKKNPNKVYSESTRRLMFEIWKASEYVTRPKYIRRYDAGEDGDKLFREQTHEVMKGLAEEFDLNYSMITFKEPKRKDFTLCKTSSKKGEPFLLDDTSVSHHRYDEKQEKGSVSSGNHGHRGRPGQVGGSGGGGGEKVIEITSYGKNFLQHGELTSDEIESIKEFQGGAYNSKLGGYSSIQRYLRTGTIPKYLQDQGVTETMMQSCVKNAESAINKFELSEPSVLYRGLREYTSVFGQGQLKDAVGKEFSDRGFQSFSADQAGAKRFAEKTERFGRMVGNPVMIVLSVRKGDHCLPVEYVTGEKAGLGKNEKEMVFAPGMTYKITKVNKQVVYAEIVNSKAIEHSYIKGNSRSGNHGHRGRPGQVGGSIPKGSAGRADRKDGQWVDENGEPLPSHIQECKIPPNWSNVLYNHDPNGDMLVKAKDSKGRDVYIYAKGFEQKNTMAKFGRMLELDSQFSRILSSVNTDIAKGNKKEEASVLKLIMTTGIRPGSDKDTKAKVKAYGATTLLGKHVVEVNGGVHLQFVGKKGKRLDIPVEDSRVASDLLMRKRSAGESGKIYSTGADKLLNYVHSQDGGGFKTKDFRTLIGTRTAVMAMTQMVGPTTQKEYKKAVRAVARAVSEKLGNTPAVALQSYIHPAIFGIWRLNSGV